MLDYGPKTFFLGICRRFKVEQVELGIYQYVPRCIEDKRSIRRVHIKTFESKFNKLQDSLQEGFDIAVHSRVHRIIKGYRCEYHIPMLDLAERSLTPGSVCGIQEIASEFKARAIGIFLSG